jgi:hypothetical protein
VAQNEQLELLRAVAACEQQDQREQPAGNQVGERHKHGQPPGRERRRHPLPATDPWQPHRASRQSLCTVRARWPGRWRFVAATTCAGRNCNPRYLIVEAEGRCRGRQLMVALRGHDRGTDGEELDHVRAPAVRAFLQLDADDTFGL